MYVSVKEGEKRVSVIAREEMRKNARDDSKICAGKEYYFLWKKHIAYKKVPLLTLMIKLNSWLISAWNANVSVSSSPAMMIVVVIVRVCLVRFAME